MRQIDKLSARQHALKHELRELKEERMRLLLVLQEHNIEYHVVR